MVSKALKCTSESAFSAAIAKVHKLKPLPVKGPRIDTSTGYKVEWLTIEQFYALMATCKPAPSQRQHVWRWATGKAKYLLKFAPPQVEFAVGVLDGQFYLMNGNTRYHAWTIDEAIPKPSHVAVLFYEYSSEPEMRAKGYDCYDSAASKKHIRHELCSFIREEGVELETLESDLVKSGALKGVLKALMGGAGGKVALKQGVHLFLPAILKLDKFKVGKAPLGEKSVKHSALIAAAIQLLHGGVAAKLVERYVSEFVLLKAGYTARLLACTRDIELEAEEAFLGMRSKTRSTSSENATGAMFPVYEANFVTFVTELVKVGTVAEIKLATTYLKRKKAI